MQEEEIARAKNIASHTHEHNEIEQVIADIVLHQLNLSYLVLALERMPRMREETRLIHEMFVRPALVGDMVAFLVSPAPMLKKYSIGGEDGRRFVRAINGFIKENYEFYEFFFLGVEQGRLKIDTWFQFLDDPKASTFHPSLGQITEVFLPLLKYEYSSSSMINDSFQQRQMKEKPILVINLFSAQLLKRLMGFSRYEAIYKVLFTLVIASLEEQEWHKSLAVLKSLCLSALEGEVTSDLHVESVFNMVKEVSSNISNDRHRSIFAFIDAFTQTGLMRCCLKRVINSLAGEQFKKSGLFGDEEEGVIELNIKIMSEVVNIYYLLRKNGIDYETVQMKRLKTDILQIFGCFDQLMDVVRLPESRVVRFSTGEDIRGVGLFRYEWFNLLRMCLLLVRQYGLSSPELQLSLGKMKILSLMQKYLSENRWNNITHCLLQKIVCLLINTQFFREKDSEVQGFLQFLIESFNNKKFVFLNSTRMTSQGDIHSLYYIARKVANELEKTSTLFNITNEFQVWRKFIVDTVQVYESRSEHVGCVPPQEQWQECERHKGDEDFKVEIDELVFIKELVKKIEINKKWQVRRQDSNKKMFRTGSSSNLPKKVVVAEKTRSPHVQSKHRISVNEDLKIEVGQFGKGKNGGFVLEGELLEVASAKINVSHSDSELDSAEQYNREMDMTKE